MNPEDPRDLRRGCLCAALLLVSLACGPPSPPTPKPDIVLVTLDTVRADRLGDDTPQLLALAREGVRYERAYSSSPLTLPSHATLLTGLRPHEHGVRDNARFRLPAELTTVTETLHEAGWTTGAFVGSFVLDARFGLDAGFDHYDDAVTDSPDPLSFAFATRRGAEVTERALDWAGSNPGPIFLWVHYFDVHAPRDPPAPFAERHDAYAGELAYVDDQVGRLLTGLRETRGDRERTVVVVGDHGESLGQHGESTHGILAYDSTLHVPLIVVSAGLPAGESSDAFVRTLDVAPTLLRAAGAPRPEGSDGIALQDLSPGAAAPRLDAFEAVSASFSLGWAELAGIRNERWKLTLRPEPEELFDVLADPNELDNRFEDEPAVVAELTAAWHTLRERRPEARPPALDSGVPSLSASERGHLAALGYSVAPARDRSAGPAPDPRRVVEGLAWIEAARAEAARGELVRGERLLTALSDSAVLRGRALPSLAAVQRAGERFGPAIATLRAWQAEVDAPEPAWALADVMIDAGLPEEALRELEPLPDSPAADELRAAALRTLGRFEEAIEAAQRARTAAPHSDRALAEWAWARAARDGAGAEIPRLRAELEAVEMPDRWPLSHELLAELHRAHGQPREARRVLEARPEPPPRHRALLAALAAERNALEEARVHYEAALASLPYVVPWRLALAGVLDRLGEHDAALALYDRLLTEQPSNASYHLDRGAVLAKSGKPEAAASAYERALELDPTLAEPHFNRGLLQLEQGDETAAIASLERAVELRPDYAKAHLLLARLLGARGDPRAGEHADRALAIELPE